MNKMKNEITTSNFQFSGVTVERLGASEYTLVTLAIDMSSSVNSYKNELIDSINTVVEACKKSQRAENLMIRLVTFNDRTYEEHGFKLLSDINISDYKNIASPQGMTALYDASLNSVEAMSSYGKTLMEEDFDVNGIFFVITDGMDNRSKQSVNDIKNAIEMISIEESLESIRSILVGVNTQHYEVKNYLNEFKDKAKFDQYIDISEATPESMAKLAKFTMNSISAQSQSLGTGGASKALTF